MPPITVPLAIIDTDITGGYNAAETHTIEEPGAANVNIMVCMATSSIISHQ